MVVLRLQIRSALHGRRTPTRQVDANEEYVGVFACKLGTHRLCVCAEIDCAGSEGEYLELKTNKLLVNKKLISTFERFKLFKFWLQSFLVGTPKVAVGFRDDDGEVTKLQTFETLKLPRMAASDTTRPPPWQPKVALHFADVVLTWLSESLADAATPEDASFVLRYEPNDRSITLRRDDLRDDDAHAAKRQRR